MRAEKNKKGITTIQVIIILLFVVFVIIVIYYLSKQTKQMNQNKTMNQEIHNLSSNARCTYRAGYFPDPVCTPGQGEQFSLEELCVSGFSAGRRDVSEKEKQQVYDDYGVLSRVSGEYEIDHLIPLSIGGTNDISNLFPQPAIPRPGFKEKDVVENRIHKRVCEGNISLIDAQNGMATNWLQYAPELQ
jgi:hypothetical protein